MIENDMIRHTRRTFEIIKSKGRNMSHKALEIFTEILMSSNRGLVENNIIPVRRFGIDGCKKIIRQIDQELE